MTSSGSQMLPHLIVRRSVATIGAAETGIYGVW